MLLPSWMPGLLNEYFTRAAIHEHSRENRGEGDDREGSIKLTPLQVYELIGGSNSPLYLFLSDAQNVR